MLLGPVEQEVGCDTCFERLDLYVELEPRLHGADSMESKQGRNGCRAR